MAGGFKEEFVVDASFVLAFLIPSQKTRPVDEHFEKRESGEVNFVSIPFLPYEVFNGLKSAVLKKQLEKSRCFPLAETFLNLGIELEEVGFKTVLNIAFEKSLSFYDAAYLALSLSKNISLLTLDKKLAALSGLNKR